MTTTSTQVGLRALADERLHIGTAVTGGGQPGSAGLLADDERYRQVLAREFSSLTAENQMKWQWLRPSPEAFDFTAADAIVDAAQAHGQQVRGHTLLWHNQNPDWLAAGHYDAQELRTILRTHIHTVVGRYAGRIGHWDVINEVFDDNAQLRTEQNPWLAALGPQIIADVFTWAHEADPSALLFGNDYAVERIGAKSDAWYGLLQDLLARGVPVHGFGVQGHLDLAHGYPEDLEQNLRRFADLGLHTAITELDIRGLVDSPAGQAGLDEAQLATQAQWYARLVRTALAVPGCGSVTVWGVLDEQSWVPGWFPGTGGALLMHGDYEPKPAYHAVAEALRAGP